jgi:hypothetical protein
MNMMRDMQYALRQWRRAPGFALAAALTLGLGIGASAAIFCLMNSLWLQPMQVPSPGRLVRIFSTTSQDQQGAFNYSEYQAIAGRATCRIPTARRLCC